METVAGLPALAAGSHLRPEQGACVMEYVSVLAGERFGDRPRCVDRRLASLARAVNDTVGDTARPRLALLAPALIGTAAKPTRSRWWARLGAWLVSAPGSGAFAEAEQHRRVGQLAEALLAATNSERDRDQALIGLLTDAVTAHRARHQLPTVNTTAALEPPARTAATPQRA